MFAKRKKMDYPQKLITTLFLIGFLVGLSSQQDNQGFYFNSQNQQPGRFVPSYKPRTNHFFSSTGTSFHQARNSQNNNDGAPNSDPEQGLFEDNEEVSNISNDFSFTKKASFLDVPARTFGSPFKPVSLPLSRVKSNGNTGVISQKPRANIPHDHSEFLSRFNERNTFDSSSSEKTTTQPSRPVRPFGNNFSRNKPSISSFSRPQKTSTTEIPSEPIHSFSKQFRSNRNKFQTSSERTSSTTANPSTEKTFGRYSNYSQLQKKEAKLVSADRTFYPSKFRNANSNITKTSTKRPIFVSREINEPVYVKSAELKARFPFGKGTYNKDYFKNEDNLPYKDISSNNHVNNEEIRIEDEKNITEDSAEKQQLNERTSQIGSNFSEISDNLEQTGGVDEHNNRLSNDEEKHVILTSNFFLPTDKMGGSQEDLSREENESDREKSKREEKHEKITEALSKSNDTEIEESPTTEHSEDYDYEYEDEENTTLNPTKIPFTEAVTTTTTTEKEFIQATTFRRSYDKLTESYLTARNISLTPKISKVNITNSEEQHFSMIDLDLSNKNSKKTNDLKNDSKTVEFLNLETTDDEEITTTVLPLYENQLSELHEEYEDDDDDYDNEKPEGSGEYDDEEESTQEKPDDLVGQHIVSVVTTKSVINGSTTYPQDFNFNKMLESSSAKTSTTQESDLESSEIDQVEESEQENNATEGYVVIASIQTSRSINGARFLPFPAIEQEEKKQTLSELERKIHQPKVHKTTEKSKTSVEEILSLSSENSTTQSSFIATETIATEKPNLSTESIIDKLDGIQSELSSGFLSGKFPVLHKMSEVDSSTPKALNFTATTKFVPNIRKFVPKSRAKPKINFDSIVQDDIADSLLPPGFKARNGFKNRKPTTTTTEKVSLATAEKVKIDIKPIRNFTIGRSFKSKPASQDILLVGLLPKDYKLNNTDKSKYPINVTEISTLNSNTTSKSQGTLSDILSKFKFEENVDDFLPKDYKQKVESFAITPKSSVVEEDLNKFLPTGYKLKNSTSLYSKPLIDVDKFLRPGYKITTTTLSPISITIEDDVSKLLPPGYKLRTTHKPKDLPIVQVKDDISKFLPPSFNGTSLSTSSVDITKVIAKQKIIDIKDSSLLPPDYKEEIKENLEKSTINTPILKPDTFKVVFPKSLNKKPRITTPKPHQSEGASLPSITIKKGPPSRATTEFTGWPTPSTTPISIEKLLEQSRTATINISELIPESTTTTTTTSTTKTPDTPKPTKPGYCKLECNLAGTIKIIEGVVWSPELLDHNTIEWKTLAKEVEAQLNEVYSNAPSLGQWYKNIEIDSFSKGSVLVDYFVKLTNVTRDLNTAEIKYFFHEALAQAPLTVIPLDNKTDSEEYEEGKGEKLVKETYKLGKFMVDPVSTDFIVIPKSYSPTVDFAEEDVLIPQWAIALIVIGVGSLCFIVIFGVMVLLNRHKSAKKAPAPLTADMLNELNKNHMGGVDNYGADDFYNVDDAWNDTKPPIKPKRFTNSMNGASSNSNIYDSWRSIKREDYYYDQNNYTPHHPVMNYNTKFDPYAAPMQHDPFSDIHQMYTYNSRPRYHPRDQYDPDF